MKPETLAAVGAVVGLALAAGSQLASDSRGIDAVVLAGFVAAGAVFALTGVRQEREAPPESGAAGAVRRRTLLVALVGGAAAVVIGLAAHAAVYDSLASERASATGPLLWAASLLVLLAAALVARPLPSWPAAWSAEPWPAAARARRILVGSIAVLVVVGAAARLLELDSVPLGINADEGDRGASAISLLSGEAPRNLFGSGWFYISNVYFWSLAGVMKVLGVGYAQARVLGAASGWLTLCVVVWIGFRHFGHRVALLTALLGTTLAVLLQFSRETTEAAPTALCWALSVAFLLEAARTGGTWPWAAAGIAGGVSLYFYPSGRLWLVLAALLCVYLVLRAGASKRVATLLGALLTGLATLLTLGPFLAYARLHPGELTLRARQVSAFSGDNALRLPYYDPDWSTLHLLWAQVTHSLAIFANEGDAGGFWPTGKPILGGVLTVLVALGVGWFTLSWRNVPRFTVALWFWVGFAGMVVTVETPNLHRMATAVPVLPLLAAGVLDATAGRVRRWTRAAAPEWDAGGLVVGAAVLLFAVGVTAQQAHFYFVTYADMDRWPQPTVQGRAVADQGPRALVMTVGRQSHQIHSGWVRLLAPDVARASVPSPGTQLPLPLPATRDLAFMLYRQQSAYLPYLRDVYPGGSVRDYTHPTEGLVVTAYRIPRTRVAGRQGSLLIAAGGAAAHVPELGAVPPGASLPRNLRWSALLRVPQYWNYALRVRPGPATLRIDGKTVLTVPAGRAGGSVTRSLARGRHLITVDGVATRRGGPAVEWRMPNWAEANSPAGFDTWREIATHELTPAAAPQGLLATVRGDALPPQRRLDGTLATCCLSQEVGADGLPYVAEWTGMLKAPRSGDHVMTLFTQGAASLSIDGRTVIHSPSSGDSTVAVSVLLRAGRHAVRLRYRVASSPGGLEWSWALPGGRLSIVPPSVLEPPHGAGVGPPVPVAALGRQPADVPLVVRR